MVAACRKCAWKTPSSRAPQMGRVHTLGPKKKQVWSPAEPCGERSRRPTRADLGPFSRASAHERT